MRRKKVAKAAKKKGGKEGTKEEKGGTKEEKEGKKEEKEGKEEEKEGRKRTKGRKSVVFCQKEILGVLFFILAGKIGSIHYRAHISEQSMNRLEPIRPIANRMYRHLDILSQKQALS